MRTSKDYTVSFKEYGELTVPKGTKVTHMTAMGNDPKYHFVDEYGWIKTNYPTVAATLTHDVSYYGINVPIEFVQI